MDDLADVGRFFGRKKRRPSRGGSAPAAYRGDREPLGLGTTTFLPAAATALTLSGTPLKRFKGDRLVIDITRSAATVTGLVAITSMFAGAANAMPTGVTSMPAAAYNPNAINNRWAFPWVEASVPITMGISISASPPAGEACVVSALIHGDV